MGRFDDAKKIAERKAKEKSAKKGPEKKFGGRLIGFFRELKAELKRVIWPDKKRMKQSTAIVLAIVVAAALLIFVVDSLVYTSLNMAGFYDNKPKATVQTEASTEASSAPIETVVVTEPVTESSAAETSASQNGG